MNTIPAIGRANVALKNVKELGLSLAAQPNEDTPVPEQSKKGWEQIELLSVTHAYRREGEASYCARASQSDIPDGSNRVS